MISSRGNIIYVYNIKIQLDLEVPNDDIYISSTFLRYFGKIDNHFKWFIHQLNWLKGCLTLNLSFCRSFLCFLLLAIENYNQYISQYYMLTTITIKLYHMIFEFIQLDKNKNLWGFIFYLPHLFIRFWVHEYK